MNLLNVINLSDLRFIILVDGQFQVTGSVDFNLKIWDIKSGEEKFKLTGHMASITSVRYMVSLPGLNLTLVCIIAVYTGYSLF